MSDLLRIECDRRVQLEPDGSGHPAQLALREAFYAFPVPTDILVVDTGSLALQPGEDEFWTLLNFNFSAPTSGLVRFHGIVSALNMKRDAVLLDKHFSLRVHELDSLRGLLLMGQWYDHSLVHLVPYDARKQVERYSVELAACLSSYSGALCGQFFKQVDFNERYGLQPDPVLDASSALKIHFATAHFVDPETGGPLTLEALQADISQIQLVPQVPEDICRTFYSAKRLYVFGYFEYGFFTVSLHYAYAAMEAALHARWSAALPIPTVLTYSSKGKVETFDTGPAKHSGIRSMCRGRGWKVQNLKVNGEPFPYKVKMVLDSLRLLGSLPTGSLSSLRVCGLDGATITRTLSSLRLSLRKRMRWCKSLEKSISFSTRYRCLRRPTWICSSPPEPGNYESILFQWPVRPTAHRRRL